MHGSTAQVDHQGSGDDEGGVVADGHSSAFFTLETLARTPEGVTSPMIVTFFVAKSMLKDVTPSILEICFLTFPSHPLQWIETLKTTTWWREHVEEEDLKAGESFELIWLGLFPVADTLSASEIQSREQTKEEDLIRAGKSMELFVILGFACWVLGAIAGTSWWSDSEIQSIEGAVSLSRRCLEEEPGTGRLCRSLISAELFLRR